MIRVQARTSIARPANDVSAFLADPNNEKRWQPGLVHVAAVGGTPGRPGATYERVQLVGGRNIKTAMELLEASDRLVAFQAKGKVIELSIRYELEGRGASTQVQARVEGEMLGFASMFEGMAAEELQKMTESALAKLKAELE